MVVIRSNVNEKNPKCIMLLIWLISLTWGLLLSACGIITMVVLCCKRYKPKRYKGFLYFEVGEKWGGINLGPIFVVNKNPSEHILNHEMGHGIQNMVFGPLFPVLIGIPSVTRARWRQWIYVRDYARYLKLKKYENIWFEKQATKWGMYFAERFKEFYDFM